MQKSIVQAAIIVIGNEVLSGRTQDLNLNFLAKHLGDIGVRVMEARVIPDVETVIIETVNTLRSAYDYVFTTGGIGPTHDDITSGCIAKAFDVKLIRHPEADKILRAYYKPEDINEARMKMADTPEGATLIPNRISAAPGFKMENVYVMAGVPRIMQAMFDEIKPELQGGVVVQSREIASYVLEGNIAAALGNIQSKYAEVDIGSYPFIKGQKLGTSLVLRSGNIATLEKAYEEVKALVVSMKVEIISQS